MVPGWQTDPAEWRGLIEDAMDGTFVLQQRIHPFTEPYPKADGTGLRGLGGAVGCVPRARVATPACWCAAPSEADAGVLNMATGAHRRLLLPRSGI